MAKAKRKPGRPKGSKNVHRLTFEDELRIAVRLAVNKLIDLTKSSDPGIAVGACLEILRYVR